MKRRDILAGGVAMAALAACSRDEAPAPGSATPSAAAPPAADASRKAFEVASRGTGFSLGPTMAARTVRIFFDPQCPHCAELWQTSKPLRERIHMVWMPVAFISPASAPQGAAILGAADPVATMEQHEELLGSGKGGLAVPSVADAQLAQVKANTELWKSLDAGSVPYLVWRLGSDGPFGAHAGALSTEQLSQMLGL